MCKYFSYIAGVFRFNKKDDEFKKSNMEAMIYSNWNKGEGQYSIGGDCVVMGNEGEWQMDWLCLDKLPYICEKQKGKLAFREST